MKRIWKLLPLIGWMGLIFLGSSISKFPLPDQYLAIRDKSIVFTVNWLLQKAIHVFEYTVLAILGLNAFKCLPFTRKAPYLFTWIIGIAFAISDEYHQLFVPVRSGRILDIVIDSATVTFTLGILLLNELMGKLFDR